MRIIPTHRNSSLPWFPKGLVCGADLLELSHVAIVLPMRGHSADKEAVLRRGGGRALLAPICQLGGTAAQYIGSRRHDRL